MKTPFVTLEQVNTITETYPTPFHLYDEKGIRENARRLRAAFAWNPGFKEYFAVKATPTPAILKILREEGCGADCSSLTELMLAERSGFGGEEIMFSSNDTPPEEFALADKLGAIINLDDITHIDVLRQTLGAVPETICCRFNPGGTFAVGQSKEGFQVMDNPGDAKYLHKTADDRGLPQADGAWGEAVWDSRVPGLQHPLQRLLPGAGADPVPYRCGATRRDRRRYPLYQPLRRYRHSLPP